MGNQREREVLACGRRAARPAARSPTRGPSWHAVAAADFNSDDKANILWQSDDGTPAGWLTDGTDVLQTGGALSKPGAAWHII